MKQIGILFSVMMMVMVGCKPASQPASIQPTATPPVEETPTPQYLLDEAKVNQVSVTVEALIIEVNIQGELPDTCAELTTPDITSHDAGFDIKLMMRRPMGKACSEVVQPFEETLVLAVSHLSEGEHSITVNGLSDTFTLTRSDQTYEANIYLIRLNVDEGCTGEVTPRAIPILSESDPLQVTLNALLAFKSLDDGVYNALYLSDLTVESIQPGDEGVLVINLVGDLNLEDQCDGQYIEAQLYQTMSQFSQDTHIFINGQPLQDLISPKE